MVPAGSLGAFGELLVLAGCSAWCPREVSCLTLILLSVGVFNFLFCNHLISSCFVVVCGGFVIVVWLVF